MRFHAETQERLQVNGNAPEAVDGTVVEDNRRTTEAASAFIENRVTWGDFTLIPALRYATARVMGQSCVGCHNTHADSTKTDWRTGDVGVLEIIRPLDQDAQRTADGLRGTFLLVGIASVLSLALAIAVLVAANARARRGRP